MRAARAKDIRGIASAPLLSVPQPATLSPSVLRRRALRTLPCLLALEAITYRHSPLLLNFSPGFFWQIIQKNSQNGDSFFSPVVYFLNPRIWNFFELLCCSVRPSQRHVISSLDFAFRKCSWQTKANIVFPFCNINFEENGPKRTINVRAFYLCFFTSSDLPTDSPGCLCDAGRGLGDHDAVPPPREHAGRGLDPHGLRTGGRREGLRSPDFGSGVEAPPLRCYLAAFRTGVLEPHQGSGLCKKGPLFSYPFSNTNTGISISIPIIDAPTSIMHLS